MPKRIVLAMDWGKRFLMARIQSLIEKNIEGVIVFCATTLRDTQQLVAMDPAASLAVCDYSVPGFPGKIKAASPRTRVILICYYPPPGNRADKVLVDSPSKPFDDASFVNSVKELLA